MKKILGALIIVAIAIGGYLYFKARERHVIPSGNQSGKQGKSFRVGPDRVMTSNSPGFNEAKAKQYEKEVKDLIAQGKYELLKVSELKEGRKYYIYKFILSDGEEMAYGFNEPLNPKK
jgi:hypothetical protein